MKKLLFGLFLALLPGCATATPPLNQWQGNQARVSSAGEELAQDNNSWEALWARIGQPAPQNLPNDKIAVAIFLGQKRTSGYSVAFTGTRQEAGQIIVTYRVNSPTFDQNVSQVITNPYAITLIPRSKQPVLLQQER